MHIELVCFIVRFSTQLLILVAYQKDVNFKGKDCYWLIAFLPVCGSLQILSFPILYFNDPTVPIYFNSLFDHNDFKITALLVIPEIVVQLNFWIGCFIYATYSISFYYATKFWIKQIQ